MGYVKVGSSKDLLKGQVMKVTVEGKDILVSNIDGDFFAIDNRCNHMGGSLVEGSLEGDKITCPKHGSVFDLKTGKVEIEVSYCLLRLRLILKEVILLR